MRGRGLGRRVVAACAAAACVGALMAGCGERSAIPPAAPVAVSGPGADALTRFADCPALGRHMVSLVAGRETDDDGISIQDAAQYPWIRPVSDTLETVGAGTAADSTPPDPIPPAARITDGRRLLTLDGTSLTVNEVAGSEFAVNIIPHTLAVTSFGARQAGDEVNVEVDMLARYVARMLEWRS